LPGIAHLLTPLSLDPVRGYKVKWLKADNQRWRPKLPPFKGRTADPAKKFLA